MKEVYPILVDKLRKDVETWKKFLVGMDAGNYTIMGDPVKKCQVKWITINSANAISFYVEFTNRSGCAEVLKEKLSFYDAMKIITGRSIFNEEVTK